MNRETPSSREVAPGRDPGPAAIVAPEFSFGRLAALTLYGALVGAPYALLYESGLGQVIRGATTGALIAAGVTLFELLLLQGELGRRLQAGPLGTFLAARLGAWIVIIIAGLVAGRVLVPRADGFDVTAMQMLFDIGFSFVISFIGITALSVKRLLGGDVIAALLSGRYYRPRTEERVFLLLDIVGSTALADRYGDTIYLGVLNRVLQAVAPVIERFGGEIHRYVGDAVIVTWRPKLALARAAGGAIACAMACVERVRGEAARFEAAFGIAPALRAAIHCGPVIAAEIGTVKREIAFVGDTMNTLARIEQAARERGRSVVLSGDVLAAAAPPPGVEAERLGDFTPRGKTEAIALYALERR
ncbi:MAG: adenylate/guanylate cyclase domain-containing protein [Rhodospirillales bacterium]|nr:adenylate/guanylate cyclase domain-containing protein [Rhodospirillales bacterium]